MKIFFENWKDHDYRSPTKKDWYYLYFRNTQVYPQRWWNDRKADWREIMKKGFKRADCGECWFSCKGHVMSSK